MQVAGTANAVHQFGTADMSGVYVAVNINFDSGVHCDNANAACNFRAVGDFLRTENQVRFVMVKVFIEFFLAFRRRSQSGTGSNTEFAGIDEVEHTILDNFGVNGEVFEVGVNKAVDNSVSNGAYAGLQRKQVFRQAAFSNFFFEECYEVFAHVFSVFVDFAERTNLSVMSQGTTATILSSSQGMYGVPMRSSGLSIGIGLRYGGSRGTLGVMHTFQTYRLAGVNFYDNFFSTCYIRGAVAHGSGRDKAYFAVAESLILHTSTIATSTPLRLAMKP